jgi:hypothetical protein
MKKVLPILTATTVLGMTVVMFYWISKQGAVIREQQKRIDSLNAAASSREAVDRAEFDLQDRCAQQALRAFNATGLQHNETAGYTNHYSNRLKKCFIETQATDVVGDTIWTYKTLSDAYEGKVYGSYSWHTVKGKKYWEVPPFECTMYPDGSESSLEVCKSGAEFDEFVRQYMND